MKSHIGIYRKYYINNNTVREEKKELNLDITAFNKNQNNVIKAPVQSKIFLQGPFGSGKTTAGIARLNHLIQNGVPAQNILVFVPQRTLAEPFFRYVRSQAFPPGVIPTITTYNGLARRMIALFWPIIARKAGFKNIASFPRFLNIETAQYYMAEVTNEFFDRGYFLGISIDPNRLLSQILDNLNKAAVVGYPFTDTAKILKSAWAGEPGQENIYEQAQECAVAFRSFCLKNDLLDYSLQIEVFHQFLRHEDLFKNYFFHNYQYLIVDNLEEDVPIFHDFLLDALPQLKSALLIYDESGGFRTFLGADPVSALRLKTICEKIIDYIEPFNLSKPINSFRTALLTSIDFEKKPNLNLKIKRGFTHQDCRFYPQMIQDVCEKIKAIIIEKDITAQEIVVLAPYLSDSLRFSLFNGLKNIDIPAYSSRPSRTLRDEPSIQCCLTLAKLTNPQWELARTRYDLRNAILVSIHDIDIIRADLIVSTLLQSKKELRAFDTLMPEMQKRISYRIGEKYDQLREWIENRQSEDPLPLDVFISRMFGELLSQSGFGFHNDLDAASRVAQLIASIKEFRKLHSQSDEFNNLTIGAEYIRILEKGLIASQYIPTYVEHSQDAVFIAPAFTFLMSNRSAAIQFWLDIGNMGWWERLDQPLTHPYVLSRQWETGKKWTDAYEFSANQKSLKRLIGGLLTRCTGHVYLYSTGMNESGSNQRGPLLRSLHTLLKQIYKMEQTPSV
ncbi:MAG TPA: hypothetical protein G4N92_00095 [Anaerolineae bacterium]|nr:hypothetical protein [Anaerolineae bacterium]